VGVVRPHLRERQRREVGWKPARRHLVGRAHAAAARAGFDGKDGDLPGRLRGLVLPEEGELSAARERGGRRSEAALLGELARGRGRDALAGLDLRRGGGAGERGLVRAAAGAAGRGAAARALPPKPFQKPAPKPRSLRPRRTSPARVGTTSCGGGRAGGR
jgi:hypothetical protein